MRFASVRSSAAESRGDFPISLRYIWIESNECPLPSPYMPFSSTPSPSALSKNAPLWVTSIPSLFSRSYSMSRKGTSSSIVGNSLRISSCVTNRRSFPFRSSFSIFSARCFSSSFRRRGGLRTEPKSGSFFASSFAAVDAFFPCIPPRTRGAFLAAFFAAGPGCFRGFLFLRAACFGAARRGAFVSVRREVRFARSRFAFFCIFFFFFFMPKIKE